MVVGGRSGLVFVDVDTGARVGSRDLVREFSLG